MFLPRMATSKALLRKSGILAFKTNGVAMPMMLRRCSSALGQETPTFGKEQDATRDSRQDNIPSEGHIRNAAPEDVIHLPESIIPENNPWRAYDRGSMPPILNTAAETFEPKTEQLNVDNRDYSLEGKQLEAAETPVKQVDEGKQVETFEQETLERVEANRDAHETTKEDEHKSQNIPPDGEQVEANRDVDETNEEDDELQNIPPHTRKVKSKYHYLRKAIEADPILKEPRARTILKKLGLLHFVRARPPLMDKALCDEFLTTYVHGFRNGHGIVQGKVVEITPEAIHLVTGLPLGTEPLSRLNKWQGEVVGSLGTRLYANKYDLNTVRLSQDEDENKILVATADVLTKKMGIPVGKTVVTARVLWGIHEAWHGKSQARWAAYMAELVRMRANETHTIGKRFTYGNWLTAMIKNSLRGVHCSAVSSEELQMKMKLDRHEKELMAREKELEQRERKVKKLVTRFIRFAETLKNADV